jgi:hypothetical protein
MWSRVFDPAVERHDPDCHLDRRDGSTPPELRCAKFPATLTISSRTPRRESPRLGYQICAKLCGCDSGGNPPCCRQCVYKSFPLSLLAPIYPFSPELSIGPELALFIARTPRLLAVMFRLGAECKASWPQLGQAFPHQSTRCPGCKAIRTASKKPGQPARFSFCAQDSGSRKQFGSSAAGTIPSGKDPRLYSAMRFFHFRKSVIDCGSMRTSTRRKLASKRFIS